jgi:glycosyltransferase involved in cell wall biosynthesis
VSDNKGDRTQQDSKMPTVGFLSHRLHSSGGQELCEYNIARGLHERSWRIVNVHEETGDLAAGWDSIATIHQEDALTEPSAWERTNRHFEHVDILYVHSTALLSHARHVGQIFGVPVVSHLHLPPYHARRGVRRVLRGRYAEDIDPLVFTKRTTIAKFVAVSRHTANLWVKAGIPADRIDVVPNGIDTDMFRPARDDERRRLREALGLAADDLTFVFVGRIERDKGIEQLLTAFELLRNRTDRRIALVVVGEPSHFRGSEGVAYWQQLQQRSPDVAWMGKRRDVDRILRASDIAVIPSQWDEPFGLVAIEAMASALPVIASARGGLPEILTGALSQGLVTASVQSLVGKMTEFIEDDALRTSMGSEGRRAATTRFDVDVMVDQVDRTLHSLVDYSRSEA